MTEQIKDPVKKNTEEKKPKGAKSVESFEKVSVPIQKTAETVEAGQIIIIVHKAKDIEKKGRFGPIPSFALAHLVK